MSGPPVRYGYGGEVPVDERLILAARTDPAINMALQLVRRGVALDAALTEAVLHLSLERQRLMDSSIDRFVGTVTPTGNPQD